MNKLNEEEIIEQFEHWIEYEKQHKDKINKADELIEIQQGLLDLYKQEKERNMELELENIGLKEERRLAAEEIQEQYYVSKDKIKAKIEEINKEWNEIIEDKNRTLENKNICTFENNAMNKVLRELLEE